jgi:uncharacterized protein involved in exopolysaccharide biosynthesis
MGVQKLYPKLAQSGRTATAQDAALITFEKAFAVSPIKSSSVIKVTLDGANPEVISEALNHLVFFYEDKRREVFKDPKSILFLEKQVAEYRQRLRKSEDELEAYKQQNQVFSIDEQRTALLQQRGVIETTMMGNENRIKELQQKLISYQEQIKTLTESTTISEAEKQESSSAQSQLLTFRLKEQELLGKYKEESQMVQDVRSQIRLLENHLASEKKAGSAGGRVQKNEVYQDVQKEIIKTKAELSSLQVTSASLKPQLESLDKEMQSFDLFDKKFRDLTRNVVTDEKNYQTSVSKLEEARVFDEMDRQKMSSVSVIEHAKVPLAPIKPKQGMAIFIAIGAGVGLGGGLASAYLLEMMKQSVATAQDVENRLALPVLATIPFMQDLEKRKG